MPLNQKPKPVNDLGLTESEQEMLDMEGTEDDPQFKVSTPSMASSEDVAGDSQVDEQGVYVPQQTSDNNNNAPEQTSKGL